jgi:glycosyltransferase involved in cell wall biosynthesis
VQQSENIHFAGLIENPESYLSTAAIYYHPSLIETQGIAVIEAMSNKVPCVVSDSGGLPECVENNKSGYIVKAKDVDEHVDKICNLLDNKELRNSFGENGYRRYLNLFAFKSFKKEMDEIYG